MKLATHIASAVAIAVVVDVYMMHGCPLLPRLIALVAAALLQVIVDAAGHDWVECCGRLYPKRNMIHSVPGTLLLSVVLGAPLAASTSCWYIVVTTVAAGLLHLVEDLVTEAGVYIAQRRVKLVGVKYDDPVANNLAAACTLLVAGYLSVTAGDLLDAAAVLAAALYYLM